MDAYDAAKENRKDQDGHSNMNGVRVRLIPREVREREVRQRRRKELEKRGDLPPKRRLPFYPFP